MPQLVILLRSHHGGVHFFNLISFWYWRSISVRAEMVTSARLLFINSLVVFYSLILSLNPSHLLYRQITIQHLKFTHRSPLSHTDLLAPTSVSPIPIPTHSPTLFSFPFRPYPLPFSLLLAPGSIPVGGAGGLPHLRRPAGHREVVKTVVLLLTDRVGLRFSKVRVPGGGGEVLVPTSSWNKSSLTLSSPCWCFAPMLMVSQWRWGSVCELLV
jgi:hypothetical protein